MPEIATPSYLTVPRLGAIGNPAIWPRIVCISAKKTRLPMAVKSTGFELPGPLLMSLILNITQLPSTSKDRCLSLVNSGFRSVS
jgi:hypothetical protein